MTVEGEEVGETDKQPEVQSDRLGQMGGGVGGETSHFLCERERSHLHCDII